MYLKGVLALAAIVFMIGCASVNKGLDNANDAAKEGGKPIGKVMKLPSSITEGAADGMNENSNQPNPFNR